MLFNATFLSEYDAEDKNTANRSRTEIFSQIMETVNDHDVEGEGITQTKLMYKVYLSGAQLKELSSNSNRSSAFDSQPSKS